MTSSIEPIAAVQPLVKPSIVPSGLRAPVRDQREAGYRPAAPGPFSCRGHCVKANGSYATGRDYLLHTRITPRLIALTGAGHRSHRRSVSPRQPVSSSPTLTPQYIVTPQECQMFERTCTKMVCPTNPVHKRMVSLVGHEPVCSDRLPGLRCRCTFA